MSDSFSIHASGGDYNVSIAPGLLAEVRSGKANAIYIFDSALINNAGLPEAQTIAVNATEQAKDLSALAPVFAQFKSLGANRNTLLYAIGGGVVQDITCFVASTYMRGIKWIYFPSTLLGMVDSCIGGKSSINVSGIKNLIGTFHPPEEVLIDPDLADSLGTDQKIAGLSEAAKICFAHTGDAFERYLALSPMPGLNAAELGEVIALSLRTKKWFIEIDEFDQNERQLLNFGHTFGHAIESATDYAIAHGIAVGVGMVCALSYQRGYTQAGKARAEKLKGYMHRLLAGASTLKAELAKLDPELATKKFLTDKKHTQEAYVIIAPNAEGFLERTLLPKNDASLDRIRGLFTVAAQNYEEL